MNHPNPPSMYAMFSPSMGYTSPFVHSSLFQQLPPSSQQPQLPATQHASSPALESQSLPASSPATAPIPIPVRPEDDVLLKDHQRKGSITVKAYYNEEIRRVIIDDISFAKLKHRVCEIFNFTDPSQVVIRYKDEEGDLISLDTDTELCDALHVVALPDLLRLYVSLRGNVIKPPTATAPPPGLMMSQQAQSFYSQPPNLAVSQGYYDQRYLASQQQQQQQQQRYPPVSTQQPQGYPFASAVPLASLPRLQGPTGPVLDKRELKEQWRNEKRVLKQEKPYSPKDEWRLKKKEKKRDWKIRKEEYKAQKQILKMNRKLATFDAVVGARHLQSSVGMGASPGMGMSIPMGMNLSMSGGPTTTKDTQQDQRKLHKMQRKQMRLQARPLYARFVKHVSVPDGSELSAEEPFVKTWRFRNEGTMAWPNDVGLLFISKLTGDQMGAPELTPLGRVVHPGEEVDVSVAMIAPSKPGHYQAYFRLCQGPKKFGQRVWVKINVSESSSPSLGNGTQHDTGLEKGMAYAHISGSPSPASLPSPSLPLSLRVYPPSPGINGSEPAQAPLPATPTLIAPGSPATLPSAPALEAHPDLSNSHSGIDTSTADKIPPTATSGKEAVPQKVTAGLLGSPIAMDSPNAYTLVNQALKQLQELGFTDSARNLRLIEAHRGNLDAVVSELMGEFS